MGLREGRGGIPSYPCRRRSFRPKTKLPHGVVTDFDQFSCFSALSDFAETDFWPTLVFQRSEPKKPKPKRPKPTNVVVVVVVVGSDFHWTPLRRTAQNFTLFLTPLGVFSLNFGDVLKARTLKCTLAAGTSHDSPRNPNEHI